MDDRNLSRRHRFGAQWKLIGDPDYTVRVDEDPRNWTVTALPAGVPPESWKLRLGCYAIWAGLAGFWGWVAWLVLR